MIKLRHHKRSEIRRRFLAVDSSNVMDALDMINRPNQGLHSDFSPYPADGGKVAGLHTQFEAR